MVRPHAPLIALCVAGAALRLWFMLSYRPAFVGYPDARGYIIAAHGPLYWDPYKPVGYPLLLRLLHALDGRLSFTVAVQHVLGLATAVVAYFATRPFVTRTWLALLPAIVVLFGGSQVFLEHSVLSDAPYTFLLAAALFCAARSLTADRRLIWLAGAGTAIAASITLRTVSVVLVPLLALWTLMPWRQSTRARLSGPVATLAPVLIMLVAYLIPQHAVTGSWSLTRATSFAFYARMAPIADCSRFTPPSGTSKLCQRDDPRRRPDANWYIFNVQSPAVRAYGVPPWPLRHVPPSAYRWRGDAPTGSFARAVLLNQPLDYSATVFEGLANYVVPRAGRKSVFEYDQNLLISELHNRYYEQAAEPAITSYYSTRAGYVRKNVPALDAYGRAAKTEGFLTALLTLLMIAGGVLSRGKVRIAALLFAGTAIALALLPVAILFYDVRYAEPVVVPLAAAAAIGVDCLIDLTRRRARANDAQPSISLAKST